MKSRKKSSFWRSAGKNPYVWLFLVISLLFGILFIRFILGEYAYFYMDCGADTFDINYPLYRLFSDVFHGEGYEDYFLNVGLGMDMSSYLYNYFNPVNLLVVLLPARLIPWGVLLATFIRLQLIGHFGYRLFYKWTGHIQGSFTAALLWTFSSYIMLWGQHYGFCTAMMMFTVFMYLVHLFADDREKSRNWLLVPWVTLTLFTSYYFLYMSGIIGALYVLVWCLMRRESPGKIFRKLSALAAMGALGVCMGGVSLMPILNIFQNSTRVGALTTRYAEVLYHPYSSRWLFGFLARLISNNTMDVGWNYTGAGNYYEMAMLFTSSLFFIVLPYLVIKKELRVRTLALTGVSVLALIFPLTGKIFTLNTSTQRWSFLICFLEAAAVGIGVKYIFAEKNRKYVLAGVISGVLLTAAVYGLLFYGQTKGYYELQPVYLIIFAVFLAVYGGIFIAASYGKGRRLLPVIMIAVVAVELAAANYPTINFRQNPTRNQVAVEYYNDGTGEAWEALSQSDPSLYRVSKTYESASENDSMVQGYPGLSAYFTTNPSSLIQLKEMYGGNGISDNFVSFGNEDYLLLSLLGVKYLLTEPDYAVSARNFRYVKSAGGKDIYENLNALPFGYLYDKVVDKEELEALPVYERTLASLRGFHFTDEKSDTEYGTVTMEEPRETSLIDRDVQAVECRAERTSEGIRMSEMEADPHIIIENMGDALGEGTIHRISVEVDAEEEVDMALYFKSADDTAFSQDKISVFHITPEENEWSYLLPGDVTDIRIDVSTEISEVTVRDVRVSDCDSDNDALEKLKSSAVTDIQYEGNVYRANVENTSGGVEMLCVPFLYGQGWKGSVDGQEVKVYSINSGLCGLEIPEGSHQVTLSYEAPYKRLGQIVSLAGAAVYAAWLLASVYKKRIGSKKVQKNIYILSKKILKSGQL